MSSFVISALENNHRNGFDFRSPVTRKRCPRTKFHHHSRPEFSEPSRETSQGVDDEHLISAEDKLALLEHLVLLSVGR